MGEVTVPGRGARFTEGEASHRSDQEPSPSSSICLLPRAGQEWVGTPADTEKEEVCLVDIGGFLIFLSIRFIWLPHFMY